jgi:VWFA-related protein
MATRVPEESSARTRRRSLSTIILASLFFFVVAALSVEVHSKAQQTSSPQSEQRSKVTVPQRPENPLYKGEQGTQRSDIEFAPASRTVTVKLQVEDANGYFLPNIHRENFAVFEDGVRQKIVDVEVEHAPITAALLMELGGRHSEINKLLADEVPRAGREFLNVIGRDDKIAVFKYDDKLQTLADFGQGRDTLEKMFNHVDPPAPSEANFYDALIQTLNRMKGVSGRKAIILITSGVDTFSKANFQEVMQAAQDSATPIYSIGLGPLMQLECAVYGESAPFAHIDWNGAEKKLETLAKISGGRAYVLETGVGIAGIYDDIMENLRLRYVITYTSSNSATSGPPRNIKVELIDPQTGNPLKFQDSNGKPVSAKVFVQKNFRLDGTPGG